MGIFVESVSEYKSSPYETARDLFQEQGAVPSSEQDQSSELLMQISGKIEAPKVHCDYYEIQLTESHWHFHQ